MFVPVSDRGERRFLWFLVLIVGVGICVFPFIGRVPVRFGLAPFVFFPLGIFLIVVGTLRLRRLGRRTSRHERVE